MLVKRGSMPRGQTTRTPPLYAQVKERLQREIEDSMRPGDALPTEPELEKSFRVSRITIRRAIDELVAEGLVVRQQGRGTFVREPQITHDLMHLLSWTTSMRQAGYEPQTLKCEIDTIVPSRQLSAMLNMGLGQRVLRVRRVRGTSNEPVCLMTNYLPESLLPNLAADGLKDDSVYATLVAHNLYAARVEDTVEARPATEWEAKLLWVQSGASLLQVTRLSYDSAGCALDIAAVSSRSDRYRYSVHFVAGAILPQVDIGGVSLVDTTATGGW